MFNTLKSKITFFSTFTLVIAMLLFFYTVYINSHKQFVINTQRNINNEVELISNDIANAIGKVAQDVVFLSKTPPIFGIIRSHQNQGKDIEENSTISQWKNRLASIFTSMLKVNPNYTQIRLIGIADNGKEIVRVNRNKNMVFKTIESALQQKEHRDYLKKAINLTQGSIMFSRLNYNIEKNKITHPLEPTLRVITPVYNKKQQVFGLIVINVNIENYLTDILFSSSIEYDLVLKNQFNDKLIYQHKNKDVIFKASDKNNEETEKTNNEYIIKKAIYLDKYKNNKIFTLIAKIPKHNISLYEISFIKEIVFWLILITIVSSFSIYLFCTKLMNNLSMMTKAIQDSIATPYETPNLPIHLNDEVGFLAIAFKEKTDMLNKLALYDSLTGLPNRKKIIEHLDEAILRSKRSSKICACLYIDLNNFKKINDTYGHDYGDELLIKFSNLLKNITRGSDFCGRLGGDEFIVILEEIESIDDVNPTIKRYQNRLNIIFSIKGITINNCISGGIAIYPEDGSSSDELLKKADSAMFNSKKENKGIIYRNNN